MSGTLILLQFGGYVGLLFWGTHMVTSGIADNLLEFAARQARNAGGFTQQELAVIGTMHAEPVQSLRLGLTVFLRGDGALRDARLLMTRKRLMRRLELEATGLRSRLLQTVDAAGDTAGGVDSRGHLSFE